MAATIFIVDDDAALVRLIGRALQRTGYDIASAASGKEAISWLEEHQPDLVLLDLKLEDMEGVEVVRRLTRLQRTPPFVVITGQGDERVAVEMMKHGALDYVVKDVNFLELLPTVVGRSLAQLDHQKRAAAAENAARDSQALTQAVLDSLSDYIAVLDATGVVVAVNQPWADFTAESERPPFCQAGVGVNYLEACRATGRDHACTRQIAAYLETVLSRSEDPGAIEYSCGFATGERWFMTRVTPLRGSTRGAVVAHRDVSSRKQLESEVLQVAEAERQRLAADLHDGVCQELTGIGFAAAALQRELARAGSPFAEKVRAFEKGITEAVGHTRQAARGLAPVVADGRGLMHALANLVETTATTHRIRCEFACEKAVLISDPIVANELYRIAQEGLANAARHGSPKRITVTLSDRGNGVQLIVRDDGIGIPADAINAAGLGLRLMKYRAALVRGEVAINPGEGKGTEVICFIPQPPTATLEDAAS